VIVATNASATQAAMRATSTIPIVMVTSGDPLLFVRSLSRPGGNVTGTGWMVSDLSIKQLELLRELDARIAKVAVLWSSANPTHQGFFRQVPEAARSLGVELKAFDLRRREDFAGAFGAVVQEGADGLLVLSNQLTIRNRTEIIAFANRQRMRSVYALREFALSGGLLSSGVDFAAHYFRAASYVDKLLKGSNPTELPVELATRYQLIVNLKSANALGLEIPATVLARADEVIE
jgi:ABC-type uncharacterized transport system substrate-binding protein